MNKRSLVARLLYILGLLFSTLPAALATLSYFPIWVERGAPTLLSGISLIFLLLSFVPLFKAIKKLFESPSAPLMWFIAFLIFFAFSRIAQDLTVICLVGFVGNLVGSTLFGISNSMTKKRQDRDEG